MNERIKVEANLENFEPVRNSFVSQLEEAGIPMQLLMKFEIVFEELFVNVCHYAYEDKGDVECTCKIEDDRIILTIKDSGMPFDPVKKEDPNIHAPIEERKIGGLGIFLCKKNTEKFEYEFTDGHNITTSTFKIE